VPLHTLPTGLLVGQLKPALVSRGVPLHTAGHTDTGMYQAGVMVGCDVTIDHARYPNRWRAASVKAGVGMTAERGSRIA
jgi:hypothetical protein